METWEVFQKKVTEAGLKPVDCGNGHWRITGGKFEVNYWPTSRRRTVYVNGTGKKAVIPRGTVEIAIRVAQNLDQLHRLTPTPSIKTDRKKKYKRVKKKLLETSPFCYLCGIELNSKTATVDHVIPLYRGGSNGDDNLRLACAECNMKKGCGF